MPPWRTALPAGLANDKQPAGLREERWRIYRGEYLPGVAERHPGNEIIGNHTNEISLAYGFDSRLLTQERLVQYPRVSQYQNKVLTHCPLSQVNS